MSADILSWLHAWSTSQTYVQIRSGRNYKQISIVFYYKIKKKKHNINIGVFGWQRRHRLEARACERERGPARRYRSRPDRGWRRH